MTLPFALGSKNARIRLAWEYRRLLSQPAGGLRGCAMGRLAPPGEGVFVLGNAMAFKEDSIRFKKMRYVVRLGNSALGGRLEPDQRKEVLGNYHAMYHRKFG